MLFQIQTYAIKFDIYQKIEKNKIFDNSKYK